MVRKNFCDKCEREIDEKTDAFDDIFNQVSSNFSDIREDTEVIKPQLCTTCERGYNKIIKETNKKIKSYLKE